MKPFCCARTWRETGRHTARLITLAAQPLSPGARISGAVLEVHLVRALELEHRPRVLRRGDLQAHRLDDLAGCADLVGVGFRQLARPEPRVVTSPDSGRE